MPLNIAILASGSGTNAQAMIDKAAQGVLDVNIALIVCNRPGAGVVSRAEKAGIPCLVLDHKSFPDRESFDARMVEALREAGAELVVLAGYMRLLTPWLVGRWAGRMVNIHPSLLPNYPGLDTHARALAAGDAEAGCTVHLVTEGCDEGPVLAQARVPVLAGDTAASLAQRVLVAEHALYPAALADFCRSQT